MCHAIKRCHALKAIVCLLAITGWGVASVHAVDPAEQRQVETNVVEVRDVVVDFKQQIDVPALQSGAVAETSVRPNQFVRQKDVLGKLDSQSLIIRRRAASLQYDSAKLITSDNLEMQFAETSLAEAEAELDASNATEQKFNGAVSSNQLRRMRLAVERARLEVAQKNKFAKPRSTRNSPLLIWH